MKRTIVLLFLIFITTIHSFSDEIKLSYLEIREATPAYYSILLKLAAKDKKKLPIKMLMPKGCSLSTPITTQFINSTYLDSWSIKCKESLANNILQIEGLKTTGTELLLRIDFHSGMSHSALLNHTNIPYHIPKETSNFQIMKTYTWLGITHILLGFDHLLFVFSLLLIVKGLRRLLWTITAFTLAHSITMAVASLGIVQIPQSPVEAVIALSIVFLAMEIMHERQGKAGLTSRYPWIVAFIFGLLHGFGFAGALAEIGLPQHAITLALIFFNIGVELGQLLFITSIIVIVLLLQRIVHVSLLNKLQTVVVYIIGGIASFWLIERTLSF